MYVLDELPATVPAAALGRLATSPCVVIGGAAWDNADADALELVDLVAPDAASLAAVTSTTAAVPLASAAFAMHMRGASGRATGEGLVAESAVYSALQAGPEFASWRDATPVRTRATTDTPFVLVERDANQLRIQLARPEVRNALGVKMRDELLEALAIAESDTTLDVLITGQGPAFCAGGDLDEFGTFSDPASAHVIRLERSIGAVLARIAERVTVHVHGACYGSGIELPAFAARLVADPGTTIALPELGLGLIPGAGGTVSITARIGRHATTSLALSRLPIDATTAFKLGLVDEVMTLS